ncbi:MAG: ester cyclase [Bacteroidota bacterium]
MKPVTTILSSFIVLLTGTHTLAQTTLENKKTIQFFMETVLSHVGNLPQYKDLHTENFAGHAGSEDFTLQQDYEAAVDNLKGVPDLKFKIVHLMAEGDYVMAHWKATGTNTAPNNIFPTATNKFIEGEGMTIFRMEKGKIAEEWGLTNLFSILYKLGLLK